MQGHGAPNRESDIYMFRSPMEQLKFLTAITERAWGNLSQQGTKSSTGGYIFGLKLV